jgi:hypothetical protein
MIIAEKTWMLQWPSTNPNSFHPGSQAGFIASQQRLSSAFGNCLERVAASSAFGNCLEGVPVLAQPFTEQDLITD